MTQFQLYLNTRQNISCLVPLLMLCLVFHLLIPSAVCQYQSQISYINYEQAMRRNQIIKQIFDQPIKAYDRIGRVVTKWTPEPSQKTVNLETHYYQKYSQSYFLLTVFFKGIAKYLQQHFYLYVINHDFHDFYVAQNQTNYIYWFAYNQSRVLDCHFKFSFDRQTSIIELIEHYFQLTLKNETYSFDDYNRDQMMQNLPDHLKAIIENDIVQHELYSPQAKLDMISCVIRLINGKLKGQKSCWFKYSYPLFYQAPFQKVTFIYKINEEADPVEFQLRNVIELRQAFQISDIQGVDTLAKNRIMKSKWMKNNPKILLVNATKSSFRDNRFRAYILNNDTSSLQLFQVNDQTLNPVQLLFQTPVNEQQIAECERLSLQFRRIPKKMQ